MNKKITLLIIILALTGLVYVFFSSLFSSPSIAESGNVALIKIDGTILADESGGFFETGISSTKTVELIEKADKNPMIKAIIIEINSGGGSVVASAEIADAVKKTTKPTVAVIREVGASGAYWVASSADTIIANQMSIVGSVGVIASYLEFTDLLDKYGITYRRLVAGKYKDMGSPFKTMTEEEQSLFQGHLDIIHQYFINKIVENRNLNEEQTKEISTAAFYLGVQAKELGLIDEFGGIEEAKGLIEEQLGIKANIVEYRERRSFIQSLSEIFSKQSFFVGEGIGNALLTKRPVSDIRVWS